MTPEEHKQRHIQLHNSFDELFADFIGHTGRLPIQTTLIDFLNWSYDQTIKPTEAKSDRYAFVDSLEL